MNLTHTEENETETNALPRKAILMLSDGHGEQTIYVHAFRDHVARIPGFAAQAQGPFYTEGFSWKFDDGPLRVTFVFSPEIKRVLTSHDELACTMSGEGRQEMSIPASKATYDFDVEFACGTMHDPKIIVSPIKGG